jgi:hypothetical protein
VLTACGVTPASLLPLLLLLLQINTDLASPGPFKLTHSRPGTVSLSLSENDEDPAVKDRPDYRCAYDVS